MPVFSSHIQLNYIVFQVVVLNTESNEAKELHAVSLAVFPSSLSYTYPSRAAIEQTVEDNKGIGGFRDEPGRGLTTVNIRGTMGYAHRREGLTLKSGWQRLREFRELVVKLGHVVPAGNYSYDLALLMVQKYGMEPFTDKDVICVNFYDFLNDEQFSVDIRSFNILESTAQNRLPTYSINMQEVGPIVATKKNYGLLAALLLASATYENTMNNLNIKTGVLLNTSVANNIGSAVGYVEAISQVMNNSLTGIFALSDAFHSVLSGNTPMSSTTLSPAGLGAFTSVL